MKKMCGTMWGLWNKKVIGLMKLLRKELSDVIFLCGGYAILFSLCMTFKNSHFGGHG